MSIRENGIMVQCPECGSLKIIVIETNIPYELRECQKCGKQFVAKVERLLKVLNRT